MIKILGLDLGTNSIGWAVVDKKEQKILDTGVRIFPEGVEKDTIGQGEKEQSKNATRREHRQSRRNFYRKRLRKIKLLEVLIEHGMCPLKTDEFRKWKDWNKTEKSEGRQFPSSKEFIEWLKLNPYELRTKALHNNINLNEFGRILYHFIQRRGFLSNRKGKEDSTIYKGKDNMSGIDETKKKIEEKTLGAYLYSIYNKDGEPYIRKLDENGKELRIRARYTLRDMYIKEFQEIWEKQADKLGLNKVKVNVRKISFLRGKPDNKRNYKRIQNLTNLKGKGSVIVDGSKLIINEVKSLKELLGGTIWEDNGLIRHKSNDSVLFWQRPLRSQKSLLVKCRFERDIKDKSGIWIQKGKTPCPVSHPEFELFRAYQFVNNIAYGKNIFLNDYQRQLVINLINSKNKPFDFKEVIKILRLTEEKFNYESDFKISPNKTISLLRNLFPEEVWEKKMDEIWHCFYFYTDDKKLFEKLKSYQINADNVENIGKIRLEEGYGSVSLKSIRNILPYLKKGYKYNDAVIFGGVRNAFGTRWDRFNEYHSEIEQNINKILKEKNKFGEAITKIKNYLANPENHYGFEPDDKSFIKLYHHSQDIERKALKTKLSPIENLRNPIVQQGLFELRRLVNTLLTKYKADYGPDFRFDQIHVELGRELRISKDQRREITRLINLNNEKNNKARERLAEYGLKPSRENIQKYLLYKEIEDRNGRAQCPYTGRTIKISDLLGKENKIQIEHIIPYSISLDDSLSNKTLCEANFNRNKGELTPYQFYSNNPNPALWGNMNAWEDIEHRAFRLLPFTKARKFCAKKDFITDDFIERQLNDTRYISRKAAEILTEICEDIKLMPGQLTFELRHLWGLNNIIQPVTGLKLQDIKVDKNEIIPHKVLIDQNGQTIKAYPVLNDKPFIAENETLIPGVIKKDSFYAECLSHSINVADKKDGKYWSKFKISDPLKVQQVFVDTPEHDERSVILRGHVEKGLFNNDSLLRRIKVALADGSYWAIFPVSRIRFITPEGKQKPKQGRDEILIFGETKEGIFNSFFYKCNSSKEDGKYWALIELDLDSSSFLKMINERPKTDLNQLLIKGIIDEDGKFISDYDPDHTFNTKLQQSKYWVVFNFYDEKTEFIPIEAEIPEPLKGQELIEGNIWVDKQTGEIRFDPKKNRDDQRHHAIDAITIALTELGYLQKLSHYNAHRKDNYRGISNRPEFKKPWPNFSEDVEHKVGNILVSYRQNKNILTKITKKTEKQGKMYKSQGYSARGRLHREFYFGRHPDNRNVKLLEENETDQNECYFHIRKSVAEIKTHKHVEKIVDEGIKSLIKKRLKEVYNNNAFDKYNIPENFFFDNNKQPVLFLPNKRGEPVPVKKVRIRDKMGNAVQLKSNINQWVNPYNNHHVMIYMDVSGEMKEDVVSFWTVVERLQQGQVVYQMPDDGSAIITTLHENDMYLLGLDEETLSLTDTSRFNYSFLSQYLYRVQKISSMYYTFRHHLASTIDNEKEEIRIVSFNAWSKYNPIKVSISILGNLTIE